LLVMVSRSYLDNAERERKVKNAFPRATEIRARGRGSSKVAAEERPRGEIVGGLKRVLTR